VDRLKQQAPAAEAGGAEAGPPDGEKRFAVEDLEILEQDDRLHLDTAGYLPLLFGSLPETAA
jgi:hypothetical protein